MTLTKHFHQFQKKKIPNTKNDVIKRNVLIASTDIFVADFPDEPPLPPSNVQAVLRENKVQFDTKVFFLSIKDLFLNTGFVIHLCGYGINIAVFSAIGTLLSQFILSFFEVRFRYYSYFTILQFSLLTIEGYFTLLIQGWIIKKATKAYPSKMLVVFE